MCLADKGAFQDGSTEVGAAQIGLGQVSPAQISSTQIGATQVCSDQVCQQQAGASKVCSLQINPGQFQAGEFRSSQITGRACPGSQQGVQVFLDFSGWWRYFSAQAKSGAAEPGKAAACRKLNEIFHGVCRGFQGRVMLQASVFFAARITGYNSSVVYPITQQASIYFQRVRPGHEKAAGGR